MKTEGLLEWGNLHWWLVEEPPIRLQDSSERWGVTALAQILILLPPCETEKKKRKP